jgi:hypothetical protein
MKSISGLIRNNAMTHHSTAEQSRERAARCLQLAEETQLPKFRQVFLSHAHGWLQLAEQQDRIGKRAIQGPIKLPSK